MTLQDSGEPKIRKPWRIVGQDPLLGNMPDQYETASDLGRMTVWILLGVIVGTPLGACIATAVILYMMDLL